MIDSDGVRTVVYPCEEGEDIRRDLMTGPRLGITVKDRISGDGFRGTLIYTKYRNASGSNAQGLDRKSCASF